MNPPPLKLLIPIQLIKKLNCQGTQMRYLATLLLLKGLHPASRFVNDEATISHLSKLCDFKTITGFRKHLQRLKEQELITTRTHHGHEYIELISWDSLKQKFDYEKRYPYSYTLEVYSTENILTILIQLTCKQEKQYFEEMRNIRAKSDPMLYEALKTVSDTLDMSELHHSQLRMFCENLLPIGIPVNEDTRYAAYLLTYGTKRPSHAKDDEKAAERFYFKADCNPSTGYISDRMKYARRNGFCYYQKLLQEKGLLIKHRREQVIENGIRTTGKHRDTPIGNTYFCPERRRLVLRLTDEWEFINPEVVFSLKAQQAAQNWKSEIESNLNKTH